MDKIPLLQPISMIDDDPQAPLGGGGESCKSSLMEDQYVRKNILYSIYESNTIEDKFKHLQTQLQYLSNVLPQTFVKTEEVSAQDAQHFQSKDPKIKSIQYRRPYAPMTLSSFCKFVILYLNFLLYAYTTFFD